MGKRARDRQPPAPVTLRELPGTSLQFWCVEPCPYCAGRHLHLAGHLRQAPPGRPELLGEQPAPCHPERTYLLTLPPRRRDARAERRRTRRQQQAATAEWTDWTADGWDTDGWDRDSGDTDSMDPEGSADPGATEEEGH